MDEVMRTHELLDTLMREALSHHTGEELTAEGLLKWYHDRGFDEVKSVKKTDYGFEVLVVPHFELKHISVTIDRDGLTDEDIAEVNAEAQKRFEEGS